MMKFLQQNLPLSLIDKLLMDEPAPTVNHSTSIMQNTNTNYTYFYECIRRDMENLLNTKKRYLSFPSYYHELKQSVIDYGLTDFIRGELGTADARAVFCELIASTIERYDPRFKAVQVSFQKLGNDENEQLEFHIEAFLMLNQQTDHVTFDATFNMDDQKFMLHHQK